MAVYCHTQHVLQKEALKKTNLEGKYYAKAYQFFNEKTIKP
jgi:hypothetical protein